MRALILVFLISCGGQVYPGTTYEGDNETSTIEETQEERDIENAVLACGELNVVVTCPPDVNGLVEVNVHNQCTSRRYITDDKRITIVCNEWWELDIPLPQEDPPIPPNPPMAP
jgi:hypothetical protein